MSGTRAHRQPGREGGKPPSGSASPWATRLPSAAIRCTNCQRRSTRRVTLIELHKQTVIDALGFPRPDRQAVLEHHRRGLAQRLRGRQRPGSRHVDRGQRRVEGIAAEAVREAHVVMPAPT